MAIICDVIDDYMMAAVTLPSAFYLRSFGGVQYPHSLYVFNCFVVFAAVDAQSRSCSNRGRVTSWICVFLVSRLPVSFSLAGGSSSGSRNSS